MPEMKRNFTGGRMNKDLDERFIKSGDYRSATNVQVSTSDEDNVGTVENILGNNPGCTYFGGDVNPIGQLSKTVGSVSDEKNDSLYWLVSGSKVSDTLPNGNPIDPSLQPYFYSHIPLPPDDPNASPLTYTSRLFKDFIMRTNALSMRGCEPVFVDTYRVVTYNSEQGVNNSISLYDPSIITNLSVGMEINGWNSSGSQEWSTIVTGVGNLQTIPLYYESGVDHFNTTTPSLITRFSDANVFGLGYGFGWGCTDPAFDNYNPNTPNDDGSCANTTSTSSSNI